MIAVIICNGTIKDYSFYDKYIGGAGLIICADGGAAHARKLGITPHLLVGDFDSISKDDLNYFTNMGVEILRFPVQKDASDTELAINEAIKRGSKSIILIGSTGMRMDHTLSNIFILKKMLDIGVGGMIVNENNEIMLTKDSVSLECEEGSRVTLLPLTQTVAGVTTKGLYYPLENATIEMGSTLGVSNEFVSPTAEICIKEGLLLVIKAKD